MRVSGVPWIISICYYVTIIIHNVSTYKRCETMIALVSGYMDGKVVRK